MSGSYTIESSKSITEYCNHLRTITLDTSPRRYRTWIEKRDYNMHCRFYGDVSETGFRIVPLIYGKNFFTPVIRGAVSQGATGALIDIRVKSSPLMIPFYVFAPLFPLLCLFALINGTFSGPLVKIFVIWMVLFCSIFLANAAYSKSIVERFMQYLQ